MNSSVKTLFLRRAFAFSQRLIVYKIEKSLVFTWYVRKVHRVRSQGQGLTSPQWTRRRSTFATHNIDYRGQREMLSRHQTPSRKRPL